MALANGIDISFTDASVEMLGVVLEGCSGVAHGVEQMVENKKGRGGRNTSRVYGGIEYSLTLTIDQKELARLLQAVGPDRLLSDIPPFPINIVYINREGYQVAIEARKCTIPGFNMSGSVDSPSEDVEITPVVGEIVYRVGA